MTAQLDERVLSPRELVTRWGNLVTERTLANWRSLSTGPKYTKLGGRIMYKISKVEEFEEKQTVSGTSNYRK